MGIEELSRFREGDDAPGFVPPLTFASDERKILVFDQSLANTGWALMAQEKRRVRVVKVGMAKTAATKGKANIASSLERGERLYDEMDAIITRYAPDYIVHEMPAARPPRSQNKEAAPIAAMCVRAAARANRKRVVMLNAQQVKTLLAGSARAEKKDVRRGVEAIMGSSLGDGLDYYNDDVVDAIALGLVHLSEQGA